MKKILVAILFLGICFAGGLAWRMHDLETNLKTLPRDTAADNFGSVNLKAYPAGQDYDVELLFCGKENAATSGRFFFEVADNNNYNVLQINNHETAPATKNSATASLNEEPGISLLRVCGGVVTQSKRAQTAKEKTTPGNLLLRRRGSYLNLCDADSGEELLSAQIPHNNGKQFGTASSKAAENCLQIKSLNHSPEPYFADDFMRSPDDPGEWLYNSGNWQIRSLDNPARSSNAFIMQGSGDGVALTGSKFAGSYRVECSLLLRKGGQAGLVAASSASGKLLFTVKDAPAGSVLPSVELKYAGKGQNPLGDDLLSSTVRSQPEISGQWRRLALEIGRNRVRAYLDGKEVANVPTKRPLFGRAGLYVKSNDAVEFDDFRISPLMSLDNAPGSDNLWETLTADTGTQKWRLLLSGESTQPDISVNASLIPQTMHPFGIIGAYSRKSGWLASIIDPVAMKHRLSFFHNGKETILEQRDLDGFTNGKAIEMRMTFQDGYVNAQGLEAFLPGLRAGRWGIIRTIPQPDKSSGTTTSTQPDLIKFCKLVEKDVQQFAEDHILTDKLKQTKTRPASPALKVIDFSLKGTVRQRPAVSRNEVFDLEREMAIWSGENGMWRKSGDVLWFRSLLFHDLRLELPLPENLPENGQVILSICKPQNPQKKQNGYYLVLDLKKGQSTLTLKRSGKEVASTKITNKFVNSLSLRRSGSFISAYADDKPVLVWKDDAPLTGGKLAWTARNGLTVKAFEPARVYAADITEYAFNNAPCDWRMAGGIWQVQNRWECDPRWSFMSGMPFYLAQERQKQYAEKWTSENGRWLADNMKKMLSELSKTASKSHLAAIWHKRKFFGDITMEMYAGPMMDQKRNQKMGQYKYFRNFAMSICADGDDLDSGYSFIAGYKNKKSVIMRKGKIVAETNIILPQTGRTHHNWYRFVVSKTGADLEFTVFEQRGGGRESPVIQAGMLTYHDPEPLEGGQVAIWCHDTGMMLARAWISAQTPDDWESPFRLRERVSACIFEKAAQKTAEPGNMAQK